MVAGNDEVLGPCPICQKKIVDPLGKLVNGHTLDSLPWTLAARAANTKLLGCPLATPHKILGFDTKYPPKSTATDGRR